MGIFLIQGLRKRHFLKYTSCDSLGKNLKIQSYKAVQKILRQVDLKKENIAIKQNLKVCIQKDYKSRMRL
jgi:hypothetical protein